MDMTILLLGVLQGSILVAISPLLMGILNKFKARIQGRKGAGVLQPYRKLMKDLGRESIVTEDSSWLFRLAPAMILAIFSTIAFSIPVLVHGSASIFGGEILAIVFLIALARFILGTAALDTGTSFGGLGASREMSLSALAEPATILSVFAIALISGTTSLSGIAAEVSSRSIFDLGAPHLMAFAALFIVLITETGRIPVDNPSTHLELTMIHEGMVLEYSGWRLALIEWGVALKLTIYTSLLITVFFPWGSAGMAGAAAVNAGAVNEGTLNAAALFIALMLFLLKAGLLLTLVSAVEAIFAKLRFFRVPDLIGTGMMLSVLAVVTVYIGLG